MCHAKYAHPAENIAMTTSAVVHATTNGHGLRRRIARRRLRAIQYAIHPVSTAPVSGASTMISTRAYIGPPSPLSL
jgi:metal-dependent HD superfamily phosphatase/phosphodiesterase